jgi:hypothetical protein
MPIVSTSVVETRILAGMWMELIWKGSIVELLLWRRRKVLLRSVVELRWMMKVLLRDVLMRMIRAMHGSWSRIYWLLMVRPVSTPPSVFTRWIWLWILEQCINIHCNTFTTCGDRLGRFFRRLFHGFLIC